MRFIIGKTQNLYNTTNYNNNNALKRYRNIFFQLINFNVSHQSTLQIKLKILTSILDYEWNKKFVDFTIMFKFL